MLDSIYALFACVVHVSNVVLHFIDDPNQFISDAELYFLSNFQIFNLKALLDMIKMQLVLGLDGLDAEDLR